MTPNQLRRAAQLLPRCKTLCDAERYFGGEFVAGLRDYGQAAAAWGLFDGYVGRPVTTFIKAEFDMDYREAWEQGRKISLAEQPA